jgi:hypothetical protein
LKYEEVHLKAGACPQAGRRPDPWANNLEAAASANGSVLQREPPTHALGYKPPAGAWAAEVSPVNLPLRLDDAGTSPATPQRQQNVLFI